MTHRAPLPPPPPNAVQGGMRYDHDFTPRLFAYVGADFQTDALQTLDLRSVFGGGLGFHVIQNDRTTLDLLGGINYTREKYSLLPSRSFAAASVGEELSQKLGMNTVLTEKLYIFPDLQRCGRVSQDLQPGNRDQDQQMAGMAECVRRYLCNQSACGIEAERYSADHRPELLVHPLRRDLSRPQLVRSCVPKSGAIKPLAALVCGGQPAGVVQSAGKPRTCCSGGDSCPVAFRLSFLSLLLLPSFPKS